MKMRNRIFSAVIIGLSLTVLVSCGSYDSSETTSAPEEQHSEDGAGIVGGALVKNSNDFAKHVVSLGGCTGTLISPKHVLTAAHCTAAKKFETVGFGLNHETSIKVKVAKSAQHASFAADNKKANEVFNQADKEKDKKKSVALEEQGFQIFSSNDVAVLTLAQAAPKGFSPLAFAQSVPNLKSFKTLIVSGYGLTKGGGDNVDGNLRFVSFPLSMASLVKNSLRIDGKGKDSCNGDSGGPVFARKADGKLELIGVVSVGTQLCTGVGYYANVGRHAAWIKNAIK